MINATEEQNDQMVEDIVNALPYENKNEDLLPITDDTENNVIEFTPKKPQSLSVENRCTESEIDFLDKLEDKQNILIPGKTGNDEKDYLHQVDIIGLTNLMKSFAEELNNQLDNKHLITLQKTI